MSEEEIKLHTIATFQGKEYELEELLNGLLKENFKLQQKIDKALDYIEYALPCIHDDELLEDLQKILKGDNNGR